MRLFYCPNIEKTKCLTEEESRHAIKVLRLNIGDEIEILDGKGRSFIGKIQDGNSNKTAIKLISSIEHKPSFYELEIVIAPTKNIDRIEWFIEKAIEIGIQKITLIQTKRTERKKVRLDRLHKISISAMKQSKTYFLPEISKLISFDDFVKTSFEGQRFIAHCIEDDKKHLKDALKKSINYQIMIGPEGDFTLEEIQLALDNGFTPVTFGKNRLRTETAAIFSCSVVNLINT